MPEHGYSSPSMLSALALSAVVLAAILAGPVHASEQAPEVASPEAATSAPAAPSVWSLGARGGLTITTGSYSVPASTGIYDSYTSPGYGYSAGLFAGYRFTGAFALDLGVEYVRRAISLNAYSHMPGLGSISRLQWGALRVPLAVQYWPMSFFGVEAGPYVEQAVGHVTGKITVNGADKQIDASAGDAGLGTLGLGILGGVVGKVPVGGAWAIELHGRYLLDLTNGSSAAGASLDLRQIQVVLGVLHSL
jgi:hypothetical protein